MQNAAYTHIRPLSFPADEAAYHALRQDGLQRQPECFRVTPQDDTNRPQRLAGYQPGPEQMIWGAFAADETLLGVIRFEREPLQKLRHKGQIRGLYVRAEAAGRGLGRTLLRTAVAFARTLPGMEQVLLSVVASNDRAAGLYRSEGFVRIGLEPRALKWQGQYFDEETMILFLNAAEPGS